MIATVRGSVLQAGLDRVVVDVGGVGMLVHTTPATAAAQHTGQATTLATTLVVREDSLTLYGFGTGAERDMFETVQTVTGVGPRLALAMLSVMGPDELRLALASGDTKALTAVPGVGPKSAQRLVLELRDKVGRMPGASDPADSTPMVGVPPGGGSGWRDQVGEALIGLGWSAKQAGAAIDAVAANPPTGADLSAYLRLALKELRQ